MSKYNTPLSPEAVEATLITAQRELGVDTTGLVDISGYTASELVSDLNKVVVANSLYTPEYEYVLTGIKGLVPVINGMKSYDYMEYSDGDVRDARADNTMDDFNADLEVILREVFEVSEKWHKKNKLPELILSDAWAVANTIVGFIAAQREANMKALTKAIEIKMWDVLVANATNIEATDGESNSIAYAMYEQLITYQTTSKSHKGIGTDGTITINGKTITPAKKFNSSDFYLIQAPDFKADITFNNDAVSFNWEATNLPLAGRTVLDLEIYEGISEASRTALADKKAILLHKDALEGLEFFNYSSAVKGASAFEVIHTFEEFDVYYRKDRPILTFSAPVVAPSKAKLTIEAKA